MPPLANSDVLREIPYWMLYSPVVTSRKSFEILEFDRHWTWILWEVAVDVSWNDTLSRFLIQNTHRFGNFSKYFQDRSLVILYSGRSANIFLCFPDYQTTILHQIWGTTQQTFPLSNHLTYYVQSETSSIDFFRWLGYWKKKTIPLFVAESIMCVRQIPCVQESFHHD